MLHFFRRIRQSLLETNRFRKYLIYAIGEIVLVMIGILLALQVNNWNQERQNRHEESKILLELKKDMTTNLERLDFASSIMDRQQGQISQALALYDDRAISDDSIRSVLRPLFARVVMTYDPVGGTIQSILNADKLKLLQNPELNRKLVNWPAFLDDVKEEEQKILHFKEYDLVPFMNNCCPRDRKRTLDLKTLLANYRFENLLLDYRRTGNILIRDYDRLKTYIQEMIDIINQEIK